MKLCFYVPRRGWVFTYWTIALLIQISCIPKAPDKPHVLGVIVDNP